MSTHHILLLLVASSAAAAGCGGGDALAGNGGPGGPGAMPPASVTTMTVQPRPVPQTSEFIATVRSLRSTTVQPQVEGIVRTILVRSGDRVRAGQPLLQIDPDKQQATVASLESALAAREADVAFAKQQLERMRTLFEAGAVSRQELEQAETAHKTADAQRRATESQIRESQVELQYYRVTAPTRGTIGDIPIRQGDRVTPSTIITTIDETEGLEAYVSVPLEEASRLKLGLPVELVDDDGTVIARNPVTFIAPRADDSTQSVLVKSLLRDAPEFVRVLQYVRARIVWSTDPAITVPIIAVNRVAGQYFVFVTEPQQAGFVARQKPVQVGQVVGEEYVVRSGLKPGDRVIVSNIQKIGDGAPVAPGA